MQPKKETIWKAKVRQNLDKRPKYTKTQEYIMYKHPPPCVGLTWRHRYDQLCVRTVAHQNRTFICIYLQTSEFPPGSRTCSLHFSSVQHWERTLKATSVDLPSFFLSTPSILRMPEKDINSNLNSACYLQQVSNILCHTHSNWYTYRPILDLYDVASQWLYCL